MARPRPGSARRRRRRPKNESCSRCSEKTLSRCWLVGVRIYISARVHGSTARTRCVARVQRDPTTILPSLRQPRRRKRASSSKRRRRRGGGRTRTSPRTRTWTRVREIIREKKMYRHGSNVRKFHKNQF
uniref:Uncharacterized protein n=1 Tax=Trichogramma kaykai TaxID=54128 RepID=A0ABD2XHE0_9HYME